MGLLEGIKVVRSSDPAFRRAACEVAEFFVDVPHEGEIMRARYAGGAPISESARSTDMPPRAESEFGAPSPGGTGPGLAQPLKCVSVFMG